MKIHSLASDQCYAWSDENTEADYRRLAKAPPSAPAPIAPAQSRPPWFPHRALQALRQARMQMRPRPRSWPQILSVSFPGLRPQMDYVPQESYAQASEFLANYHHARQILEEICEINRELLRRRAAL
jgi:hypothetical protein